MHKNKQKNKLIKMSGERFMGDYTYDASLHVVIRSRSETIHSPQVFCNLMR